MATRPGAEQRRGRHNSEVRILRIYKPAHGELEQDWPILRTRQTDQQQGWQDAHLTRIQRLQLRWRRYGDGEANKLGLRPRRVGNRSRFRYEDWPN